jgi:hypothetical protein
MDKISTSLKLIYLRLVLILSKLLPDLRNSFLTSRFYNVTFVLLLRRFYATCSASFKRYDSTSNIRLSVHSMKLFIT